MSNKETSLVINNIYTKFQDIFMTKATNFQIPGHTVVHKENSVHFQDFRNFQDV